MTYEQALEIKQNLTPEQVRNDLERYLLRGEAPIVKGVAMAMQALEKQTPKKPLKIGDEYIAERCEWVVDYECPSCGNPYADDSYCSCCGQALDWGDGE